MACKGFMSGGSSACEKLLNCFLNGKKVGKNWNRVVTFEKKHAAIFCDLHVRGEFTHCNECLSGCSTALNHCTVHLQ